ncbi:hypothetical protein KSP40_PGU006287 [Platanthera guangdongensis]|uniref:Uncharacterized protein n=1 Tax=Platanthera guangdongensis TaxID=2320717 RepID=A0ABR2M4K1_9ASPA
MLLGDATTSVVDANVVWLPRRKVYDGLLLDAGGTLLQLARHVEETYASIGKKYGIDVGGNKIKQGFKRAFAAPWPEKLQYQEHCVSGDLGAVTEVSGEITQAATPPATLLPSAILIP